MKLSTGDDARPAAVEGRRTATRHRYLMCPPTHFDVVYSINPWMDPSQPVDPALALQQWQRIHDVFVDLGHTVELIPPVPGLPDMVFAANGATVVDGHAMVARFRGDEGENPLRHRPSRGRACLPRKDELLAGRRSRAHR